MRPFGALDNVWCKVSGMVTEADWTSWQPTDLEPYVDHVLNVFGAGRLLFGSDWPVCLLAASYQQVFDATRAALSELSPAETAAVFGESATEVYRLP
jgi:L-fuconolactonase